MIRFKERFRATGAAALVVFVVACSKSVAPPATEATAAPLATGDTPTAVPAAAPTDDLSELLNAKVIHWSVVGDYAGEDLVLNVGTSAYAPVTDHVEIGFDYTMEGNGGLVGTPTFVDSASQMGALRNGAKGCRAPVVTGHYEHSSIESIADGLGGQLAMKVRTDYPAGSVPVACTGGNQPAAAKSSSTQVDLLVPSIGLFAMGDQMNGGNVGLSPDKRSLLVKSNAWTYKYTPTKVR